jgi:homoserine dehydrogenase
MQKRTDADESPYVSVVIVTHATTETSIREALALTMQDGFVRDKPQVIRIERP